MISLYQQKVPAEKVNRAALRSRYGYISGRIRVLEMQLLDGSRLNRLHEARSPEDVARVLAESGYPQAADPETSLACELEAVYSLLLANLPEPEFAETLLVFHDIHNVKVVLKHLLAGSPAAGPEPPIADERMSAAGDSLLRPELSRKLTQPGALDLYLRRPSMVSPDILVKAITEHKPDLLPDWLANAAAEAVRCFRSTCDFGEMDLRLDKIAWSIVLLRAQALKCGYFTRYLQCRIDLVNLDLLLRTRFLRSGAEFLEKALIPGGTIENKLILPLYSGDHEAIRALYERTPYFELAGLSAAYGSRGSAARFSLLADNLLMDLIREATRIVTGPEIALAYLFAREMEMKNIRIILTGRRNGLSQAQTRDMTRNNYLAWR